MALFVGAMSGTSIDGLDLAVVDVDADSIKVRHAETIAFPSALRAQLAELASPEDNEICSLGRAQAALGEFTGTEIVVFLRRAGLEPSDVVAIGSHGQTIRHHPAGIHGFSLQIGDASRIAAITNIDVVCDFRSADIAVGGEGAPLVPVFHQRCFRASHVDRVILNIGGISNVTYLPAGQKDCLGFDTGPGNSLLDAWTMAQFAMPYDDDGAIARTGIVDLNLLKVLSADAWFEQKPPKSTGKEHFNYRYIERALSQCASIPSLVNTASTLVEYTAATVAHAIVRWCCKSGEVIVCGGGRLNGCLMARLRHNLPGHTVKVSEEIGIDGDSVESATFAYLAYLFVHREPGNVCAVTGARERRVLGCMYPGAN